MNPAFLAMGASSDALATPHPPTTVSHVARRVAVILSAKAAVWRSGKVRRAS